MKLTAIIMIMTCFLINITDAKQAQVNGNVARKDTTISSIKESITPFKVDRFFISPKKKSSLRWKSSLSRNDFKNKKIDYIVRDYWDNVVEKGIAKRCSNGEIKAKVKLPVGFYTIELYGQHFGIASIECLKREQDPFFAIDGAMSWLGYSADNNVRLELLNILKRCGISMIRERLKWGAVNPADGDWRFDARRYERVRNECHQAGIPILEVFHDCPKWTASSQKGDIYPADLTATAKSWATLTSRFGDTWGALEVWNEPDLKSNPPDLWVPMVKAVVYGVKQAAPDTICGSGAFAVHSPFVNKAAESGIFDYLDFVSFHTYAPAPAMAAMVSKYRETLAQNGQSSIPLWLTETGRPWKTGTSRPSSKQGQESALDCTMKIIEAKACGVERAFPFIFGFFQEGQSNFGFMGEKATPLRGMGAYANLIKTLAGRNYIGDLTGVSGVERKRVFAEINGKEAIVVLYTGKPQTNAFVTLDLPIIRATGIDGRKLAVNDQQVPIDDGLTFVWVSHQAVIDRLNTKTGAMKLRKMAQGASEPHSVYPIISRVVIDNEEIKMNYSGYSVPNTLVSAFPLKLRLFNLSKKAQKVMLEISTKTSQSKHQILFTNECEIAGDGSTLISKVLDLSQTTLNQYGELDLQVTCRAEGLEGNDRLAVHLSKPISSDMALARYDKNRPLPIREVHKWHKNQTKGATTDLSVLDNGTFKASFEFTDENAKGKWDRWAFPRFFGLPDPSILKEYSGLVLNMRITKPGDVRIFAVDKNGGKFYSGRSLIPDDGKWHCVAINFSQLSPITNVGSKGSIEPSQLDGLEIGINSKEPSNSLEIKNIWLVEEKTENGALNEVK